MNDESSHDSRFANVYAFKWLAIATAFSVAIAISNLCNHIFSKAPVTSVVFDLESDGSLPESILVEWDAMAEKWTMQKENCPPAVGQSVRLYLEADSEGVPYGLVGVYSMFRFPVFQSSGGHSFNIPCWRTNFDSLGNAVGAGNSVPGLIRIRVSLERPSAVAFVPSLHDLEAANWESP